MPVSPESYTDPNLPKGRKGRNNRHLTSSETWVLSSWKTSVSGAFKRGLMRQRAPPKYRCCSLTNLNASVLTASVRICLVRALKERKSQLPVAIFDFRDVNVVVA